MTSPRSVAAYAIAPVALAVVVDRVVADSGHRAVDRRVRGQPAPDRPASGM
jgi:hypothetical protein